MIDTYGTHGTPSITVLVLGSHRTQRWDTRIPFSVTGFPLDHGNCDYNPWNKRNQAMKPNNLIDHGTWDRITYNPLSLSTMMAASTWNLKRP